jgi:hypothetical protein
MAKSYENKLGRKLTCTINIQRLEKCDFSKIKNFSGFKLTDVLAEDHKQVLN